MAVPSKKPTHKMFTIAAALLGLAIAQADDGAMSGTGGSAQLISFGKHWVEFTVGSKILTSSSGAKTTMAFPARLMSGKELPEAPLDLQARRMHTVGFASLIRALGGKATLGTEQNRLDIWLPKD